MNTKEILNEVLKERERQNTKWGIQDHPNGTGGAVFKKLTDINRKRCESSFKINVGTWENILTEEVYEAFAEGDPNKLREELIQVAAVCVSWCEAIDRKSNG